MAIARSQPVASLVTGVVVAAACGVILATTGQAAAAEARVLRGIDEAGTMIIAIEDHQGQARIAPTTVKRIEALDSVVWVVGFSQVSDVRNAVLDRASVPVPARIVFGKLPDEIRQPHGEPAPGQAVASPDAARGLGLAQPVGAVAGTTITADVVGSFVAAPPLDFLNGSVLVAEPDTVSRRDDLFLRSVYLKVADVESVEQVTEILRQVVDAESEQYTISTPQQLVELRRVVASELSRSARQLMLVVLGVGLVVVAVTLFGAVSQRRRDFGRRRALGASRSTLVWLVLIQSLVASGLGAILGVSVGLIAVQRLAGGLPSTTFTLGVFTLAVLAALVAAVPPAVVAAVRDPVRILRVP